MLVPNRTGLGTHALAYYNKLLVRPWSSLFTEKKKNEKRKTSFLKSSSGSGEEKWQASTATTIIMRSYYHADTRNILLLLLLLSSPLWKIIYNDIAGRRRLRRDGTFCNTTATHATVRRVHASVYETPTHTHALFFFYREILIYVPLERERERVRVRASEWVIGNKKRFDKPIPCPWMAL